MKWDKIISDHANKRAEYLEQSQAAYKAGDGAKAKELSEKGKYFFILCVHNPNPTNNIMHSSNLLSFIIRKKCFHYLYYWVYIYWIDRSHLLSHNVYY